MLARGKKYAMTQWALAAMLAAALAGCSQATLSDDSAPPIKEPVTEKEAEMKETANPPADNEVDRRLVSATTRFGFNLFDRVWKENPDKNVFISPASVGMALAMTYNGAGGSTREAMERTLELQGLKIEEVNRAYADWRGAMASGDEKVELAIANSLWARQGMAFNAEFLERNRKFYDAEARDLDFNDPASAALINGWVKEKTKGKIDKIIDRIPGDAILYLLNAIYFKGKWANEFAQAQTREVNFYLADGTPRKHPMMHQSGNYDYLKGDNFQAISLPYGDGRIRMDIFLPEKGVKLDDFVRGLSAEKWQGWMQTFRRMPGDIGVPRFRLEYETNLNEALKEIGMGVAFDANRADFSAMISGNGRAFISEVKHKTFIEVNEEGTEAAATTSVGVALTSAARPVERFQFIIDRPFFCAIRDRQTGAVLFMGAIVEPL